MIPFFMQAWMARLLQHHDWVVFQISRPGEPIHPCINFGSGRCFLEQYELEKRQGRTPVLFGNQGQYYHSS
jgi:hypothetical protein